MKRMKLGSEIEVFDAGVKALHKALGPVEAHRFMSLLLRRKTDYVKISRKLYKGKTVDQIFEEAKALAQARA